MPKQIVILGGGYIAVEFAGIFAGLGSEVHLVYRADLPLRGFDEEASRAGRTYGGMLCLRLKQGASAAARFAFEARRRRLLALPFEMRGLWALSPSGWRRAGRAPEKREAGVCARGWPRCACASTLSALLHPPYPAHL